MFILVLLLAFVLNACGSKDGPVGTLVTLDENGCHSKLLVKWTGLVCEVYDDGEVVYSSVPFGITYYDGWFEIDKGVYTHGIVGVR